VGYVGGALAQSLSQQTLRPPLPHQVTKAVPLAVLLWPWIPFPPGPSLQLSTPTRPGPTSSIQTSWAVAGWQVGERRWLWREPSGRRSPMCWAVPAALVPGRQVFPHPGALGTSERRSGVRGAGAHHQAQILFSLGRRVSSGCREPACPGTNTAPRPRPLSPLLMVKSLDLQTTPGLRLHAGAVLRGGAQGTMSTKR
jgi:hypothetical protein